LAAFNLPAHYTLIKVHQVMFTADVTSWSQQTAARLRCVQSDFATAEQTQRELFVLEEIHQALKGIVPDKRTEYLAALSRHFPQAESAGASAALSRAAAEEPPQSLSPEQLLEQLVAVAPLLNARKREAFGLALQKAGYLPTQTTLLADEPPPELLAVFPVKPGRGLDIQRTYRVLQLTGEFFVGMDKVAWNVWRAIAPKSSLRKDASPNQDLAKLGARYIEGDNEVSFEQLRLVTQRLRQLLAGVLAAIGPAGRSFAMKHLAQFSPDAIRDAAAHESGFFSSIEQKCWRKYNELAQDLTPDLIESEIQEAIAHNAENLIRVPSRGSNNAG
jgi:hypothetical protein